MQKTDDQSFGVGAIRFHPLQEIDKLSKICENKMEKNGQGKYIEGILNRISEVWRMKADRLG